MDDKEFVLSIFLLFCLISISMAHDKTNNRILDNSPYLSYHVQLAKSAPQVRQMVVLSIEEELAVCLLFVFYYELNRNLLNKCHAIIFRSQAVDLMVYHIHNCCC